VPVAVGFGISRPDQAAALKGKADGIVIGTALVKIAHESGVKAAADFVRTIGDTLTGHLNGDTLNGRETRFKVSPSRCPQITGRG